MKMFQPKLIAIAVAMAATGGVSVPSFAQDQALEEIVTIGTRGKPRSATSSVAPPTRLPRNASEKFLLKVSDICYILNVRY